MARRFSAALLWLVAAAIASGSSVEFPELNDFRISANGIVVKSQPAVRLEFLQKLGAPKIEARSTTAALLSVPHNGRCPSQIRTSVFALGPDLYFKQGLCLKLAVVSAPFLSWPEGSVAVGVPTPKVTWAVLSFQEDLPPIFIGFPGTLTSLRVSGAPGAWQVETTEGFKGWVRLALPIGTRVQATRNASQLGILTESAKAFAPIALQPVPRALRHEVTRTGSGVTAVWTMSGPGARIPPAALLAESGGYPVKVVSKHLQMSLDSNSGPVAVTTENQIALTFPLRPPPSGRGVTIGAFHRPRPSTVRVSDRNEVVQSAFDALSGARTRTETQVAEGLWADFQTVLESGQAANGEVPLDLIGAYALLRSALLAGIEESQGVNRPLELIARQLDWSTWLPNSDDLHIQRRAAAYSALAGSMSSNPRDALLAAMLHAGLAGQRGYMLWRVSRDPSAKPSLFPEPLDGVRQAMFDPSRALSSFDASARTLLSPLRVLTSHPVQLQARSTGLFLVWRASTRAHSRLVLSSSSELRFTPDRSLRDFSLSTQAGRYEVNYAPAAPGICAMMLVRAPGASPLPLAAPWPTLDEPMR